MNEKIPIKSLSEQVASRVNIEVSDAQGAIKSIFSLIAEVLKEGKSVTINGLGTFSPDVNPLEPVAFIPDAELAEELNAPFSMFEPERLSDSVSEADLNQVGIQESTTDNTDSTLKVEIQSAQTQETPCRNPLKIIQAGPQFLLRKFQRRNPVLSLSLLSLLRRKKSHPRLFL